MSKVLRAAMALLLLAATPAFSADMPVKAPPPPPAAPAYNWTGFYIGGNAGYGWQDPTVTFTPNDIVSFGATCGGGFGSTCAPPASFGIDGGLGGIQVGYNWQANQAWLIGVEADLDWSGIKGTGTSNFLILPVIFPPGSSNFVVNQNVDWFGTVRGRLGWLPANNILLYGTAGFAYGRVHENVALNGPFGANSHVVGGIGFACFQPGGLNCFLGNSSRTATGWTAGGGVEYVLWKNFSVKAEYLFVSLGGGDNVNVAAQTFLVFGGTAPSSFTAGFSRTEFQVVRGGLNWKLY